MKYTCSNVEKVKLRGKGKPFGWIIHISICNVLMIFMTSYHNEVINTIQKMGKKDKNQLSVLLIIWAGSQGTAILRRKSSLRLHKAAPLSFGPRCIKQVLSRWHRHSAELCPASWSNDARPGDLNTSASTGRAGRDPQQLGLSEAKSEQQAWAPHGPSLPCYPRTYW